MLRDPVPGLAFAYDLQTMYLVVIGILSLILAFTGPPFRWGLMDRGWIFAAVAAATLIPPGIAWLLARRALKLLDRNIADPSIGQYAFGRGMVIIQTVLGVSHAAIISMTNWLNICEQVPVVGKWFVIPGFLAALPFLVSILLIWIVNYPADRAIRQIAVETFLFRGRPARPVWELPRYLLFNLRHQVLFIFVPMLLILLARDAVVRYDKQIREWTGQNSMPDLLLGASALIVAVIAPSILRRIWVTQPLPEGPLRDRLLHLCSKLKMRCREILIWHSGGMIVNAAVMGVIAPFRYFLITDAMLEQLEDRHIEAVFGHEAGHVKKHHIFFFLLFAFISGCLVTSLSERGRGMNHFTYQVAIAVVAGFLMFKWGVLFGWISRAFERQADLYGVRTLAASGLPCQLPCAVHPSADNPGPAAQPANDAAICQTAAHLFGDTLDQVAVLNGIPTHARSWRHGSISLRNRTLIRYASDTEAVFHFERRVARIKLGIALAALVSGLLAAWDLKLWTLLGIHAI